MRDSSESDRRRGIASENLGSGPPAASGPPPGERPATGDGVRRGTGRDRTEWFALLDAWGAAGRPYREIAEWLMGEHDLSRWWAQKLIVEYEQARGLRDPGVRRDGTFEVGASRTVVVPLERLFAAFVEPEVRERWLPGVGLRERTIERGRLARFDWADGVSRVVVNFSQTGEDRSQVVVQHQRLPDATSAEKMKTFWRERLATLKSVLEG